LADGLPPFLAHSHTHSSPFFLPFFLLFLFCHREDEHDWQTANNKQRARNLHLDEFNDDDEKDATEGKIILIEAGKKRNFKEPTDSTRCLLKAFWFSSLGCGSVGCCCLANLYEDAFWVALRNV